MVSSQTEFNNKYSKEAKDIKLKNKDFKEKQLIVENYSSLERLYLRGIDSIDKVILSNLKQLEKCTISDCGIQELVIENCSQIKELDVSDNSLTSLEFLASLKNLEELEVDGNPKLIEILKPYKGD
jgi:Leucine-rich repeat (LRR) protein